MFRQSPQSFRPSRQSVRSDINMTPLVDVCLVLLIIFMVVTPQIGKGGKVDLPETQRPLQVQENPGQMVVSIDAKGQYFLDEQPVAAADLQAALAARHASGPRADVRLRADKSLGYASVRHVMGILNEVGFTKAGLLTAKKTTA